MKLERARIRNFRCVDDSEDFTLDEPAVMAAALVSVFAVATLSAQSSSVKHAMEQDPACQSLVPAAAVCTVIIAIEVLLATEALGPAYERLDVMAVERSE